MTVLNTISYISVYSHLLPAFLGLYYFLQLHKDLKLLTIYLLIAACTDTVAAHMDNNYWLINVYILIEYVLLANVFSVWQKQQRILWIFRINILLFIIIWVIKNIVFNKISHFDSFSFSLSSILLALTAIYTLISLQKTDEGHSAFIVLPQFWVSSIVLIYYGGSIVIHSLAPTLESWTVRNILNISANLLYTVGFLWQFRSKAFGY